LHGTVLDLGFGHGFLSCEIAVQTNANVVAIDFLGGDQLRIAKSGVRTGGLEDRISFVTGDARRLPFSPGSFECVVSFLALEDVNMTGGRQSLTSVIENSVQALRPGGLLAFADDMFLECAKEKSQKLYSRIQNDEFQAGLPSKEIILSVLTKHGLRNVKEVSYDPNVTLGPEEAKVELKDVVEAKPFGKSFDFAKLWQKHGKEIETFGLSYPSILLISVQK
jgi:cyclopropane fatty-acyl-phospholipid synthase-like methyltransferase